FNIRRQRYHSRFMIINCSTRFSAPRLELTHCFARLRNENTFDITRRRNHMEVKIYTKPGCPHCAKAREYYTAKGIHFEDLNAQDNLEYRAEMLAISDGEPTVPVIVENGRLKQIGWEGRG